MELDEYAAWAARVAKVSPTAIPDRERLAYLGLGLTGCGLFGSATSPDGGGTSTHSSAHGAAPAATRAASAPRVTGAASNQARSATPGPPAPPDRPDAPRLAGVNP